MDRADWGTSGASPGRAGTRRRSAVWTRSRIGRAAVKTAAAVGAASLSLFGGVTAANAAPGDTSSATGTFLGGSILNLVDLDAIANLEGARAANGGTEPTVTDANTLDLTALGVVNVTAPGGVQIPVDLGSLGVVGQYAAADPQGGSVGASGAVGSGGVIGTGAPATGPLSIDLSGAVDSLSGSVAAGLVDEIADLDLTLEAVSARAAQSAPDAPQSQYFIAGGQLVIGSATLAALTSELDDVVAGVQADVDGVDAAVNASVRGLLGVLGGTLTTNLSVGTTSLTDAVDGLLTGELTSPDYPGVSIDLSTGSIIVDLDAVQPLNGLAPGTNVLGAPTVAAIETAVLALVDGLIDDVADSLVTAVRGLPVTGNVAVTVFPLPTTPILTVNTTVGALLDGETGGLTLLGLGLTLPGGLAAVVSALTAPVQTLVTDIAPALDGVLEPVNAVLFPALDAVVPAAATVTVNNQSTSGDGAFSVTGAIVTILPGSLATTIALANATVGPNALDDNADVGITTPEDGAAFVVAGPDDVSDVTITGTGEPGAEITVSIPGQDDQVVTVGDDGTWTAPYTDLPVGSYSATATQDADGTTATVTFDVVEAPDVAITAPDPDRIFVVPGADDTADVTVEGTGLAGGEVEIEVGGETQTVTVEDDGTWTATFEDLPIGGYAATATQPFDGSTASVDFSVAETPDVVIAEPTAGTEVAVGQTDDTTAVTVSGTASPGATVTVVLDDGATETALVAEDGGWNVVFADLPIGDYTATATQDADDSSDSTSFAVVLADAVAITAPADGTDYEVGEPDATRSVTVSGTGQTGAEVEVTIPGVGSQTATVAAGGTWTVVFAEVPVGAFTATAVQDIDGSSDSSSFSIAANAADADAVDADATDADAADADAGDADAVDAEATDADALDVLDIDATEVLDALDVDADADVLDADADVLDIDADADGLDVDVIDADALDVDVLDADADVLDIDADGVDAVDADAVDADADAGDADAVDADVADADAADADAADVLDADATDVVDADADAADADVADADADATDADAADVLDADATDVVDADADATDADATDADATDADATDGGAAFPARADVALTQIVRGAGVTQTVVLRGFEPGETISATVNSTPFDLAPAIADASGSVRMTFAVGADFELGAHRVDVRGSVTGELPTERENTAFTVTAQPVTAGGGGTALPATGMDLDGPLVGGFAAALILAGAALWTVRRRSTSGEQR